jgi:cytoskeletal protein CcmA (bactofilin family)
MAKVERSEAQMKQTTVEEGTEFKGTLHSQCEVVVRGVVDGDLTAPSVVVAQTGTVVGNVKADCLRSEGVLAGRVDADDVYLSGSVRSDTVIRAKTLEVKLHRDKDKLEVTFGACILEVGDDPAAEAPVAVDAGAQDADAPAPLEPQPSKPARARRSVPAPAQPVAAEAPEHAKPNGAPEDSGSERRSVPPLPS